jgi:glycerol-3-phosphate dehydrogenase
MAEDVINIASKTANLEPVPCMTENLKLSGHDQPAPPPQVSTLDKMELRNFIQKTVQEEMCMTVEDLLARRSRELFLDARKAVEMAPLVAAMMAEQMNKDQDWIKQQIDIFNTIAADYITKT